LVIQLVPTGKIVTVNVVKSSGNDAFDRSAEQAVRAVDTIPELKEMEIATFERNFRTINLLFNPEDLRL
jgi:colicin import membrane protein